MKKVIGLASVLMIFPVLLTSCKKDQRALKLSESEKSSSGNHDKMIATADNAAVSPQESNVPKEELALTNSNVLLAKCPNYIYGGKDANGGIIKTYKNSYLAQNACWYFSDSANSCTNFCKNFYGLDSNAMTKLPNNTAMCQEIIKGINPQQASTYKPGTSIMATAGSVCAWVISGTWPNLSWYMVSQSTYNPLTTSVKTQQVCACDTEGFPNYNGLGLSYRNSIGTSGKKGIAMSINPTYLTQKTIYTPVFGPIECKADPSTPLPQGLSAERNTCRIFGTPTAPTTAPLKIKINAYDLSKQATDSLYKSNDAFVTISIAP